MTVEELLEAESVLEGEALVAVQLEYLRSSDRSFPGILHERDECSVCDSRLEALNRHYEDDVPNFKPSAYPKTPVDCLISELREIIEAEDNRALMRIFEDRVTQFRGEVDES